MDKLTGRLSPSIQISGRLSGQSQLTGRLSVPTARQIDVYTGETEITPSEVVQYLQTANKIVIDNITINPIPSNYGLITWDGSTLTVS